ncbi:MAG: 3-dehydroquinate synthase [Steroidobacteraceae bacterium]
MNPVRLEVTHGTGRYPILVGSGLLSRTGLFSELLPASKLLVVSHPSIQALWGDRLDAGLGGRQVHHHSVPEGEQHKTLASLEGIFDAAVSAGLNRDCAFVALGGGVVGDITGFAAACYQRGVSFLQVPTTLLAQVDSSVGGKTAVDHSGGKNLIGAFHQPVGVVADTDTLGTLPDRELRAGLAEVIKYGLIMDADFLAWLETHVADLIARQPQALEHAILTSCRHKAAVVGRDEREQGERALLNLGHTFGHAIETGTRYGEWLHGEAVAVGMVMAAELSARLGWLAAPEVGRLRELISRAGLPCDPPRLGAARMLELMALDKKVRGGRIRLVLLQSLGRAVCTADYPDEALLGLLSDLTG